MPESETLRILTDGFREVARILDEESSTLAADPVLAELANLAGRDPESDGVKLALLNVLESREFPAAVEVIQYFAHRFRWGWLQKEVQACYVDSVTSRDRRNVRRYERMVEAFADDWEDRDLFPSLNLR